MPTERPRMSVWQRKKLQDAIVYTLGVGESIEVCVSATHFFNGLNGTYVPCIAIEASFSPRRDLREMYFPIETVISKKAISDLEKEFRTEFPKLRKVKFLRNPRMWS